MEPRFSFNYDGIPFPELNCTVRQEGDDTCLHAPGRTGTDLPRPTRG